MWRQYHVRSFISFCGFFNMVLCAVMWFQTSQTYKIIDNATTILVFPIQMFWLRGKRLLKQKFAPSQTSKQTPGSWCWCNHRHDVAVVHNKAFFGRYLWLKIWNADSCREQDSAPFSKKMSSIEKQYIPGIIISEIYTKMRKRE